MTGYLNLQLAHFKRGFWESQVATLVGRLQSKSEQNKLWHWLHVGQLFMLDHPGSGSEALVLSMPPPQQGCQVLMPVRQYHSTSGTHALYKPFRAEGQQGH